MEKTKKIEVNGKMYNLSDVDKINVREKATIEEIPFVQWLRKTFKFIK